MDPWYFPRTELAKHYLTILETNLTSSLAMIAPRRKGKTLFLLNDMVKLAQKKGYEPIYASLWQDIDRPHLGLLQALEKALSTKKPFSGKFDITKASVGNDLIGRVEMEFAKNPQKTSSQDLMRLDQLLSDLEKKTKGKTLLLLIDEVQHLATSPHFEALAHTLRTLLDKRQGRVKSIFTGSSRHYMHLLLNDSHSPFFHFSEMVTFPDLGDDFIDFTAQRLKDQYRIILPKTHLAKAYHSVDQSPYWMIKLLVRIVVFKASIDEAEEYILALMAGVEGFDRIEKNMRPIDKIVFTTLANNQNPFSTTTLQSIEENTSLKGIAPNVQRSLQRLITMGLITQMTKGTYIIEKPGLKKYLDHHVQIPV